MPRCRSSIASSASVACALPASSTRLSRREPVRPGEVFRAAAAGILDLILFDSLGIVASHERPDWALPVVTMLGCFVVNWMLAEPLYRLVGFHHRAVQFAWASRC